MVDYYGRAGMTLFQEARHVPIISGKAIANLSLLHTRRWMTRAFEACKMLRAIGIGHEYYYYTPATRHETANLISATLAT